MAGLLDYLSPPPIPGLLRRTRSGGGSDPDWLAHLAELGDSLPPRDMVERAPGQSYQGYIGEQLHPNALGIYAQPRPAPAGDEVIRSGQPAYAAPAMPGVGASNDQRWFSQQTNPSYFPGPEGSTRIGFMPPPDPRGQLDPVVQDMLRGSLGQQLPPGLPLGVQDQIRNQPSYGEGEVMAPEQWWNQAEGGPLMQSGPQREERLSFDRREALGIPDPYVDPWLVPGARAVPEGAISSLRPPSVSPYASPLNQLMQQGRRLPFALY